MVRTEVTNKVLFSHYKEADRKNVIKLLLRCKLLYHARAEVVKALRLITEVEEMFKPKSALTRILVDNDPTNPARDSFVQLAT